MGNSCYRDEVRQGQEVEPNRKRPQSIIEKPENQTTTVNTDDDFCQFANLNSINTNRINIRNEDLESSTKVSIEDFQLMKVLGKGSFGKVMLVEHKERKQLYAMKVLLKNAIKNDRQMRHTMTERVILEMMDNEFMVKLHYAFQTESKLYLVVDYMGGGELFFYLRKYIRFNETVVQFYAAEVLLALQFMHENNIIYRDLKPENVLLDSQGHVKLADFGLSKILDKDQKAYSLCGTPEYLAPEIITSTQSGYTKQCDWWSFGAVMYEMLTGAPPFYSHNRKEILKKILTYPVPIPDYLSESAQKLLKGLLTIDPQKRIGSKEDAMEIRNHPFFKEIDFVKLTTKQLQPPTQFQNNASEFKFFDQSLIRAEVKDTPVQNQKGTQFNFSNFTYQKMTLQGESQVNNQNQLNKSQHLTESMRIHETLHESIDEDSGEGSNP